MNVINTAHFAVPDTLDDIPAIELRGRSSTFLAGGKIGKILLVDIGVGAGVHGGSVVASGSVDDIIASKDSITGKYLSGELSIPVPIARRSSNGKSISIKGARQNNLKNVDVEIPLGVFNCVTGV